MATGTNRTGDAVRETTTTRGTDPARTEQGDGSGEAARTEQGHGREEVARTEQGDGLEEFAAMFGATRRGARLARRVAVRHLAAWGHHPGTDLSETVALLVAELAGNAVRHGRVPGRDFRLALRLDRARALVRVEVADACALLPPAVRPVPADDDESGRGLLLVDALADRWGAEPRDPVGKTVWAEVSAAAGGDR
ncbi:ATP-binding protein [Streptomyces zhihengii]